MQEQRLVKLLELHAQNPQETFVIYALGMEYLGLGQPADAEGFFVKCLHKDSAYIPAYYQLGLLYWNGGKETEALETLQKGLQMLKSSKDSKTIQEFRTLIEEISF